jgi:hypothetical protein
MFIMKKLLSCLLAFCLLCGLGIYNTNSSIPVKANDTNIEIINEPLKGEEFNHVFTQEELKGTEYEGKNVEVRDGVMYVEGRSVVAMACYLWATSSYVLVGWMASGQFQATVDWFDKASLAYDLIKDAWNRFGPSASSTYVKGSASTVYLTSGNVCYRQSSNTYACKYSLRPDEDSD